MVFQRFTLYFFCSLFLSLLLSIALALLSSWSWECVIRMATNNGGPTQCAIDSDRRPQSVLRCVSPPPGGDSERRSQQERPIAPQMHTHTHLNGVSVS
uniref:Putative secreted protein n=1 Tax=Anopheles darlingi TaxID=43151 RepID=A0A2M4DIB7_ANODA